MRALRATALLTLDMLRRFLREGMVLRSLVFPVVLAAGSMALTILAVVMLFGTNDNVAISTALQHDAMITELEAGDWKLIRTDDPRAMVATGDAIVGTDGETIWLFRSSADALAVEGVIRTHLPASWKPGQRSIKRQTTRRVRGGRILVQFIGGLFAFYGVVFGAGSVARDRDQGTLEAELAMPIPMWVHGLSRWLAGSLLLSLFFALGVAVFDALLGLEDPMTLLLHGSAASTGATAIGLVVIGRAGLESGFGGPMAAGLITVVFLLQAGVTMRPIGALLPVASLAAQSDQGWPPLLMSILWGLVATWLFTRRSTVR